MIKKLLAAVVFLAIAGGFAAYRMYNKPHQDISSAQSIAQLDALTLLQAFKDDETNANVKYLDKVITLSGKIAKVQKEQNLISVQLETDDPMSTIICNFDPFAKHTRLDFKEGELITIKGLCSGYLSDVVVDRCVESK